MENNFKPGDILLFLLPKHFPQGHEQEGQRPVIVIAMPKEPIRYPVLIVVPLTTTNGYWVADNPNIYIKISKSQSDLSKDSIALLDQICAVDIRRIKYFMGTIDKPILQKIQKNIINMVIC